MPSHDVRRLTPGQLATLLNSAMFGEITSARQMRRHRERAGSRIGDGKIIDLIRYVGWLHDVRQTKPTDEEDWLARRERRRRQKREQAELARDIGEIPAVVDPERRDQAVKSFRKFCEFYFSEAFYLDWSDDHLKVIAKIERSVLKGGLFAMAMPRGSGKTTLCECACLWATLIGAREFVALIGSTEKHAAQMLEALKTQLEHNDLLLDDFPEVVYPIRCLEGIANRSKGQMHNGRNTQIEWKQDVIVYPTIEGSRGSSAIINVAGLTGGIRGMKFTRPDRRIVRPSLVIIDDPQTDDSARSPSQCKTRESILAGAVLNLAGPGVKVSGVMPCTVICPGDMSDSILDREKHPEWNGMRTKMIYRFPSNEKLWDQYAEIYRSSYQADLELEEATAFYEANRPAMDEGALVAWDQNFVEGEASAVQHAMNLRIRNEEAFYAECQNEPLIAGDDEDQLMTADAIAAKVNRIQRGLCPNNTTKITMFVDVQQKLLWYLIVAWEEGFGGAVIDYGSYPDQRRKYFTLRDSRITLAMKFPSAGIEGAIYAGLEELVDAKLNQQYRVDGGGVARIDRCLIDANWSVSTDVVYQFCRQSAHGAIVWPSHGIGITASGRPMNETKRKRGELRGLNWYSKKKTDRPVRSVNYDTNYWKSFVHARLKTSMGDHGCLALFGRAAGDHRMLSEQLTAEFRVKTQGRGRTVDEWKEFPSKRDNHYLDCLAGCAVAASMVGISLETLQMPERPQRFGNQIGMTLAERRAAKRAQQRRA